MLVEFLIDEFHAKGHSGCSLNYNTSQFKSRVKDSSLAEQKNSPLSELKKSFAHMDQATFLLMLRFKLACMNFYQFHHDSANSDVVFWKPPPRRVVIHGEDNGEDDGEDDHRSSSSSSSDEEEDDDEEQARSTIGELLEYA